MSQPSEEIERIAILLDCDYVRTITLSELNVDVHYTSLAKPLMVFNGVPDVVTTFSGAEPIDRFNTELHFLILQPNTSEDAEDIDVLLEQMKKKANSFYWALDPSVVVRNADTYTLELSTTSNDLLVGYKMTINLAFSDNVCAQP